MMDAGVLREIAVLKENDRQKISLVSDYLGRNFLRREIYDDKCEIYKTLQRLGGPGIPKIYSVIRGEATIVTEEYIQGKTLTSILEEGRYLTKKTVYDITNQLIDILIKLHGANIIHRDIKPDNIIVDANNTVWLTDYDIARIYRDEIRRDTEVRGTFGYAPIEQFGMMPTDFKSDIFALGKTINEMLKVAGIKGALKKIADKCCRMDPVQRYESVQKVKKAILTEKIKLPLILISVLTVVIVAVSFTSFLKTSDNNVAKYEETEEIIAGQYNRFFDFQDGENERKYMELESFENVLIYDTDYPWEHLVFTEDINKKGRIRLGKDNTMVSADITLENGELQINLDDGKGKGFKKIFRIEKGYEKEKDFPTTRKNADIICRDLNYDNIPELIIGLSDGAMIIEDRYVFNNLNYSVAWCIMYDEEKGFKLCEGEMFSKGGRFTIIGDGFNVMWDNFGEVAGYELDENENIKEYY